MVFKPCPKTVDVTMADGRQTMRLHCAKDERHVTEANWMDDGALIVNWSSRHTFVLTLPADE